MHPLTPSPELIEKLRQILFSGDMRLLSGNEGDFDRVRDEFEAVQNLRFANEDQFLQDVATDPVLNRSGEIYAGDLANAIHEIGRTYWMIQNYGDEVYEGYGRPSHTFGFVKVLEDSALVESIVSDIGIPDGRTFLVSTIDGNSYEVQVRPAALGKYYIDESKRVQYQTRKSNEKVAKLESIDLDEILRLAGIL